MVIKRIIKYNDEGVNKKRIGEWLYSEERGNMIIKGGSTSSKIK